MSFTGSPISPGKRLEILKEIIPKLRRVVTFYDPRHPVAIESSKLAREAAQRLGMQLVERTSLRRTTSGVCDAQGRGDGCLLRSVGPADQYPGSTDHRHGKVKRLPTMFAEQSSVIKGGLASYSVLAGSRPPVSEVRPAHSYWC